MQSFNSNYIEAVRYVAASMISGVDLEELEEVRIFIPSLSLDFSKHSACRKHEPFTSMQAWAAVERQIKVWKKQEYKFTQKELDTLRSKADLEFQQKVLVPLKLALDLYSLVEINLNNKNSMELVNQISKLSSELFSKVAFKK